MERCGGGSGPALLSSLPFGFKLQLRKKVSTFLEDFLMESVSAAVSKSRKHVDLAERAIPQLELRRLRKIALRMVERMKVGDAGITQALVDSIHEKWREDEVVKLKFEGPQSLNMKRTHETLESRTGGFVIWRSGSSVVLYRGMAHTLPCVQSYNKKIQTSVNSLKNEDTASDVFHSEGGRIFMWFCRIYEGSV